MKGHLHVDPGNSQCHQDRSDPKLKDHQMSHLPELASRHLPCLEARITFSYGNAAISICLCHLSCVPKFKVLTVEHI